MRKVRELEAYSVEVGNHRKKTHFNDMFDALFN